MNFSAASGATWVIAGITTVAVIVRPLGWPEAVWALALLVQSEEALSLQIPAHN